VNCRFCGRFAEQIIRTGQSGMRCGIYSCRSRERKSLMLACFLLRKKWTVSGHHLGKNCCSLLRWSHSGYWNVRAKFGVHPCVCDEIYPSQARRAGLSSQTRACMGIFTRRPVIAMGTSVHPQFKSIRIPVAGRQILRTWNVRDVAFSVLRDGCS
jgi:hypothetical protein